MVLVFLYDWFASCVTLFMSPVYEKRGCEEQLYKEDSKMKPLGTSSDPLSPFRQVRKTFFLQRYITFRFGVAFTKYNI